MALERLSWHAALLAAVGFGVLQGSLFIQKVRAGVALAESGYFNLGNFLIAVAAVWISIRGLKRGTSEGRTHATRAAESGKVRETSFLEDIRTMPDTFRRASTRHPIVLTVLIASLAVLPLGLWSLATGRSPLVFGLTDWMLIGLAELPTVVAIGLVVWGSWKSRSS